MNLDRPLPQVNVVKKVPAAKGERQVLVIPVGPAPKDDARPVVLGPAAKAVPKQLDLELLGAATSLGSVARTALPSPAGTTALLVGVGSSSPDTEQLRNAAGSALQSLQDADINAVLQFDLESTPQAVALIEGALLGAYRFGQYHQQSAPQAPETITVVVPSSLHAAVTDALEAVITVITQVWRTRDLVNMAPNDLNPATFADYAVRSAKLPRTKVTVHDEKTLEAKGFGGHLAVGRGSTHPPRLVKIAYRPPRAKTHVALVGKGITFDSGGLSLKPAKSMETMKCDMAGAATVLGTVIAASQLKLPIAVTGWLCLAENMPSGTATRPSDVISIYGGKTVEVLNTDAEGRLVLADGLVAAAEERPDLLVDIATLTGAQMVALGAQVGAVMGTDNARSAVQEASRAVDEPMWPMPLPAHLRTGLDSKIADISNMGERYGGMLTAGLFLKEFVGESEWAHLDIAGPAFNEGKAEGIRSEGGTGFGLRTLLRTIEVAHEHHTTKRS